jgi:hypothetical protein
LEKQFTLKVIEKRYLREMNPENPIELEKLKPMLHLKISGMNPEQLMILNRVILQLEAEQLAEQLGEAFARDRQEGKLRRISELVRQFRAEHPYK